MDGKWLLSKLNQNGFTPQDLASQTGLPLEVIEDVIQNQSASKEVWDVILDTLNDYPAIRYPDASIIDSLKADLQTYGAQGQAEVYYGVSDHSIVFCCVRNLGNNRLYGANVPFEYLSTLVVNLEEALTLFTRQNCAISSPQA